MITLWGMAEKRSSNVYNYQCLTLYLYTWSSQYNLSRYGKGIKATPGKIVLAAVDSDFLLIPFLSYFLSPSSIGVENFQNNKRPSLHIYGMIILVNTKPLCIGMALLPFQKFNYNFIPTLNRLMGL